MLHYYPILYNYYHHIAVQPGVSITTSGKPILSQPFQATCTATLQPRVATYLLQYLRVDWIGTDGHIISQKEERMSVGEQQTISNTTTRSLVFDPLNMTDGGNYSCDAKLILPNAAGSFNTTQNHHLDVLSK